LPGFPKILDASIQEKMIHQLSQAIKLAPPKRAALWIPLFLLVLAGSLLVLVVFALLAYQIIFLNRAYPGVTVADTDVGGMSRSQIIAVVESLARDQLDRPITITADDQSWTFTGQQMGMRVDAAATADQVFAVGRHGNLVTDIATHFDLLRTPHSIEPIVRYDTGPTNQVLMQLGEAVNYPPQNAEIRITPDGIVEVTLSQRGRRLHIDSIKPQIEAAIFGNGPQNITAITQQILPAIDMADLNRVQEQARALLGQPLAFNVSTPDGLETWQLEPHQLAPLLTVTEQVNSSGKPQVDLAFDAEQLRPYVEQMAEAINRDPVSAEIYFDTETNRLAVSSPSRAGQQLDVEATLAQVEAVVAIGGNKVNLPVSLIPAQISSDDLDSLGIEALVSEQTSYFAGSSQGRMSNIELAASKFDGVIIPPGQIFSFNEHLGPVTKEEGFDESLIIFGNRTTVGIGGGVCQVSTTVFRAALYGGFELVERWAHGYRVSWYETNSAPGLDATIYTPDVDLKFRNDTDHHLLIHTETNLEDGTVTFKFYGTPTDREVIVSEPIIENISRPPAPVYEADPMLPPGTVKQIDWAKDGMDVTVTRIVKEGDTVLHDDEIVSQYRAWRDVYQVSPDKLPRRPALSSAQTPPVTNNVPRR
jgi:vancomycin resistance protein YoaR